MKNKKTPPKKVVRHPVKPQASIDKDSFLRKYSYPAIALFAIVFVLFLTGVFKNISYPLFWADESMTVVGSERVIEFGYPKVHDGKNVFYDLRHTNPELGIDKETDAYIGGTSWLHYYFGTLGVKMAAGKNDLYEKTGTIRRTFAIAGVVGLLFLAFAFSSLFRSRFEKFLFAALFFTLELFSVSLQLLIREARYYPLTIFLVCAAVGIYILSRGAGKISPWLASILLAVVLWLSFFAFSSVFFILLASLAVIEVVLIASASIKKENAAMKASIPFIVSLSVSLIGVFPFLSYFRTFEISAAMAEFNGYNSAMYWDNVTTVYKYFSGFELLWLFILLKLFVVFNLKNALQKYRPLVFASLSIAVILIVYTFAIGKIPNFIYTRYIIPMQPLLVAGIVCDLFLLFGIFSSPGSLVNFKNVVLMLASVVLVIVMINKNGKSISGHMSELSEPYKGPLDFTIPYIKEKFAKTDTLVIATNYEESSYMYYLHSKVVVGYTGNNLAKDSVEHPHIIAYRKPWGNFGSIFQGFVQRANFEKVGFQIHDNPVNNIPELNFMPVFNHKFKTIPPDSEQDATEIFILAGIKP